MSRTNENVIEWITGQDRIALSLSQQKHISKVKALKEKFPNEVDYVENMDGSIFAHLPLKALKLNIVNTEGRDYSKGTENLKKWREENA